EGDSCGQYCTNPYPGETIRLRCLGIDSNFETHPDMPATWTSTNPDVLMVDEDGVAVALAEGTAEVVAQYLEFEATLEIEVGKLAVDRIDFEGDPWLLTLVEGK